MKRDLAIRALNMAIAFRSPPKGCIHHTDRGSQYCSHDYQKILRQHGFKVSMSGKGNCYDNAAVETFFKTIKAELIWRDTWETRRKAEMAILNTSTASTTRAADTQHWAGKAPSLSNGKWLKRALGAALKRDRSKILYRRFCSGRMCHVTCPWTSLAFGTLPSASAKFSKPVLCLMILLVVFNIVVSFF